MSGSLFGTTLVHLQVLLSQANAQLWSLSYIIFSVGYMSGGFLCGVLFDRFNWEMLFTIFALLLSSLIGASQLAVNFLQFVVWWTITNVAMGYVDAGMSL